MSRTNRKLIEKQQKDYLRRQARRIMQRKLVLRNPRYNPGPGAKGEFLQITTLVTPIVHPAKLMLPSINQKRNATPTRRKLSRRPFRAAFVKVLNLLLYYIGIRRPPRLPGECESPTKGNEGESTVKLAFAMRAAGATTEEDTNNQKGIKRKGDDECNPAFAANVNFDDPIDPQISRLKRMRMDAAIENVSTESTENPGSQTHYGDS